MAAEQEKSAESASSNVLIPLGVMAASEAVGQMYLDTHVQYRNEGSAILKQNPSLPAFITTLSEAREKQLKFVAMDFNKYLYTMGATIFYKGLRSEAKSRKIPVQMIPEKLANSYIRKSSYYPARNEDEDLTAGMAFYGELLDKYRNFEKEEPNLMMVINKVFHDKLDDYTVKSLVLGCMDMHFLFQKYYSILDKYK